MPVHFRQKGEPVGRNVATELPTKKPQASTTKLGHFFKRTGT